MTKKPTYEDLKQRVKELEGFAQNSEVSYREIFDLATDMIIIQDINTGEILEVNDAATRVTGFTPDEIKRMGVAGFSPKSENFSPEKAAEFMIKAAQGEPQLFEWGFIDKSGQFHPTEVHIKKVSIRGQARLLGIVRDITERKRVEEALKRSEANYRSIFNAANDAVFVHETETGRILDVNNKMCEMYGYTREEVGHLNVKDLSSGISPYTEEDALKWIKKATDGDPQIFEWMAKDRSGRLFWVEVNLKRVTIGDRSRLLAVVRDITERKQSEEALRVNEEKYRLLAHNMNDVVFIQDINLNITYTSPSVTDIFGYSVEETYELYLKDLMTEVSIRKATQSFQKYMALAIDKEDIDIPVMEYEYIRKDGSTFWGELKVAFLRDPQGQLVGSQGAIRDITHRKQAEKALQESEEKLARSKKMESLGLLAGGVAHDLNNVLSGIVSYPELLLMNLPQSSELRKPIETIQESGHRAVAIVQDLLTVARGVAITKEPLDLNSLVDDYLRSPELSKLKRFHPTFAVNTNLDNKLFHIAGSDVHIRKALMNLVSNASEAEGSCNVIISTTNRYIDRPLKDYDDVATGEYAVLAISDDGSGISPDDLERIFEPFYTKKVMGRSGTGLGLAVVWNIMLDHKGYINVITDENGTTFELYFPITREDISAKDLSIPVKKYKGTGETILVVDDVESQREISCNMLDALGYETKAVSSGEEAVEYLKENSVNLLLLDMIMDPGMNGLETYERIIKIHPNQKAVIVSGFAETEDVKGAQELGAGTYVKKPLTLEKIGLAVKNELKKNH
jgi:PAS domain S-box-containing protein